MRATLLHDDGSATVTTAGIVSAVASLALVVVVLAAGVADSHRARVAADLSAVAGANALYPVSYTHLTLPTIYSV